MQLAKKIALAKRQRSQSIPSTLVEDVLNPTVAHSLENALHARKIWKQVSDTCDVAAHVLMATTGILAFLAPHTGNNSAVVLANGCTSTLSVVLLKFSCYASERCEEEHRIVQSTLSYFKTDAIPSLQPDMSTETNETTQVPVTPVTNE